MRLRFCPGDSLRAHDLLVYPQEPGAVEVYLNGRLVQRQGRIAADPARVVPRGRYPLPGTVPAGGPAEQVLGVRYAPWQPPLPLGLDQAPQLVMGLFAPQQYGENVTQQRASSLVLLVLFGLPCYWRSCTSPSTTHPSRPTAILPALPSR